MVLFGSWRNPTHDPWGRQLGSQGLLITTALSLVLIIASSRDWVVDGAWYESDSADISSTCAAIRLSMKIIGNFLAFFGVATSKRASTEFLTRLAAIALGFFHVSTMATLTQRNIISDLLGGFGTALRNPKDFARQGSTKKRQDEVSRLLSWVVLLSGFGMLSAALWAGAMTLIPSSILVQNFIDVPSFENMSLIKEYPVESAPGPSVITRDGLFSYSVGTKLLNPLIASGSFPTTFDSTSFIQGKPKIDNTGFFYQGRSYGVGSSVGIADTAIRGRSSSGAYRFQEIGYVSGVECHYNKSTNFRIAKEYPHRTYAVTGFLPDTVGSAQWSEYIGSSPNSIVAIGVAESPKSPRRYVSIAAGEDYKALNTTECTIDFSPTLFQVSVGAKEKRIVVVPLSGLGANDFDPQRALARTAVRQFDLMSNSLTSFHSSVIGDAIFSSIAAWNISHNPQGLSSEADATLAGLQNSLTAMMDSMLEAYGAAQLVVGNFSQPVVAGVAMDVYLLGNKTMVYIVSVLNAVIAATFWFKFGLERPHVTLKSL